VEEHSSGENMTDNQLFALIISAIKAGQQTAGIPNIPILQANQATQQGVNTDPTIYIYKIGDHRFGWPERIDVWNPDTLAIDHRETQAYETTFQISALATQKPDITTAPTASDILNSVAYILQSDTTITAFENQGVGLERVMDLRNPYFINDHARFQASPSFDFVVTHKQIFTNVAETAQTIELNILTV
jgi:hypothetical protein